jgi:hypothetical protein
MPAYQTVTTNADSDINAELLLMSRLEHTTRIVFCPLVVVVNMYNDVCQNVSLV